MQCLGEMPWLSRATAIKPDAKQMILKLAAVKQRSAEASAYHSNLDLVHADGVHAIDSASGNKVEIKKSGPAPMQLAPGQRRS